ncbi:MAG: bifunctional oligoribonuclease/PAP phosphatase NrnA [Eubacteriales bacterium]|nr:bifunctional oligoribonuclease/PAP phosphatase NrnA [Eubacteriales bacterium]
MSDFKNSISKANRIMVAGHIRPDGDCIGACIALHYYIQNNFPGKTTDIYLETLPERFLPLDPERSIVADQISSDPYDLFIAVDCSSSDRLGKAGQAFLQAEKTICVDHHISNASYADENFLTPDSSSTCEVLFELMGEDALVPEIAAPLYVGIAYDSGVFRYSNTSARTMEIAGKLIQTGIPFWELIDRCISQRTYKQTQLLGRTLQSSLRLLDGKCIVGMITMHMMQLYGAKTEDIDGIIEQLRVTEGVEVAILLFELSEMEYKVSMRSNGFIDVSQIAVHFSGGGHKKAAGFQMDGSLYDVINGITEYLEQQLDTEGIIWME